MSITVDIMRTFETKEERNRRLEVRNRRLKQICIEMAQYESIMAMTHLAMSNEYETKGAPSKTSEAQFNDTVKTLKSLSQEMEKIYHDK